MTHMEKLDCTRSNGIERKKTNINTMCYKCCNVRDDAFKLIWENTGKESQSCCFSFYTVMSHYTRLLAHCCRWFIRYTFGYMDCQGSSVNYTQRSSLIELNSCTRQKSNAAFQTRFPNNYYKKYNGTPLKVRVPTCKLGAIPSTLTSWRSSGCTHGK